MDRQRKQAWRADSSGTHLRLYRALFSRSRLVLLLLCLCSLVISSCTPGPAPTPVQLPSQPGQTSIPVYVALGASDTFGIGAANPYTENWPGDLADLLGGHLHLINLGVPGMLMHNALATELPVALDTRPTLITIWLAVNDLATNVTPDSYQHDLDTMLQRLQKAAPRAQIEVGNVPDLTSVPFFFTQNPVTLRQKMTAYNTLIARVVQQHHAILVDLSDQQYNLQAFPNYISSDGLHPSTAGYLQIARLFYSALQKKQPG